MVEILKRYYKLIVVMFLLVTTIFYGQFLYSSGLVTTLAEEKIKENFTDLSFQINHWMEDKELVVEDISSYITYSDNSNENLLPFLNEKLTKNPEINSLYYLDKNNNMVNPSDFIPSPEIDFRQRPWYTKAVLEEKTVFTDAFLNATEDDMIVSVATPVYDSNNDLIGVVAGDISLKDISTILSSNVNIPGAEAFLVDSSDSLIIDSGNSLENKIVSFNNQDGKLLEGNLNGNNWKILLFVPEKFISGPLDILKGNFITTLLMFFATMLIFTFLQRKVIAKPLESYEKDSKIKIETERKNFEALFKNSSDAIAIVDNENRVIEVNEKFEELFKYKESEIKGIDIDTLIVTEEKIDEAKSFTNLLFKDKIDSIETIRYDKDGVPKDVELKGIPILVDGNVIGGYASYTDISARKAYEKKILYMSYHDQLTGLFNRRFLEEKIVELDSPENYPLSIVMADLNGLKLANDAFGHAFGDKLLKKTAEIISSTIKGDGFAARFGGDEFVIVFPNTTPEELKVFINDITEKISNTKIENIDLSISFGWETKTHQEQDLIELMNEAESYMYKRKLSESPSMISSTIKLIINTLHEKNIREKLHSERVGEICALIGKELGFVQEEINELKLMGLMHDIGKIGIDEKILNKEGKLTEQEYEEIKKHPEIGYRILSSGNQMSDIAEYTLAHHERWDGKGYPHGKKGTEIPLVSRIIAVADAYDAMTSERTYRKPLTEKEAVEELKRNAGTQFDPQIVEIFTEKVLKS